MPAARSLRLARRARSQTGPEIQGSMKQTAWLVQRAALAVVLMVSFYALALGIAGALLWIPYEAYVNEVQAADQGRAGVCRSCRHHHLGGAAAHRSVHPARPAAQSRRFAAALRGVEQRGVVHRTDDARGCLSRQRRQRVRDAARRRHGFRQPSRHGHRPAAHAGADSAGVQGGARARVRALPCRRRQHRAVDLQDARGHRPHHPPARRRFSPEDLHRLRQPVPARHACRVAPPGVHRRRSRRATPPARR